jgi:phosphoenolpyruvate carboxykinase (ATP)
MPSEMLIPRNTWRDPAEYDRKARELAQRFIKNFEPYQASAPDITAGGPVAN